MSAPFELCEAGDGESDFLSILVSGVDVWNPWRRRNRGLAIDLSGTDFGESDLQGAGLRGVNLRWSYLGRTNLSDVDFRNAMIDGVDLCGADLRGTNLAETAF